MIQKYNYKKLTWIDLHTPTQQDVSSLIADYKIHPIVGEELLAPTMKPKVDAYKNYLYLVLHFPIRVKKDGRFMTVEKEIDFIVGQDFIITTKYDEIEPLHNFSKIFEVNSIIDKSDIGEHAGFIFYYMIKKLYKHMAYELEAMHDALLIAEKSVFEGDEKNMVTVLSNISREIIDFKQISKPHKEVLESLSSIGATFFGNDFKFYTDDIRAEFYKIHESIVNIKELLSDLRETNDSLLSTKQNETMKTLTILAFVTFPLTLITGIFGMNTTHVPIIGYQYDFETIIGIMILVAVCFYAFFKKKKWL